MDAVKGQPKEFSSDLDVVRLIAEFDKQTAHLSFPWFTTDLRKLSSGYSSIYSTSRDQRPWSFFRDSSLFAYSV